MYQNFYTSNSNLFVNRQQNSKRNDGNRKTSIYNANLLHIKDLTQEILESEYEPINKVPLSEEEPGIEGLEIVQLNSDDKKNTQISRNISCDSVDACFNTLLKNTDIFKIPQIKEQIFSSTPDRNQKTSIYNAYLFHIKDLTQEILESEYEPINKVPLSEEEQAIEGFEDVQLNSDDKENTQISRNVNCDSVDACFNKPLKNTDIFKVSQINEQIFSCTPRVLEPHKEHLITNVKKTSDVMKYVINNVTYRVLKQLGRGGSAVVYDCLDIKNNVERAIKVINLDTDLSTVVEYQNEVQLLQLLNNCEHIIKMLDYKHLQSEKKLLVVLEKGGSDLRKLVRDLKVKNKNLSIHKVLFYWMEMLYAVQEIHQNGIVHADLKPSNFLQVDCGLKLIDFGIASRIKDQETSIVRNHVVGSFNYISPEALTNISGGMDTTSLGEVKYMINCKSDVWSLGCILYELLYGKTPFEHIKNISAKLSTIMDSDHKINYPTFHSIPQKFIDTIKSCLQYDVKNRISVDDLIREYENIYN